jgi:hypothetical protein
MIHLDNGTLAEAALFCLFALCRGLGDAQVPPAASSPTPSPTPSDPCGSILSIVTRPTVTTSTCTVRAGHALLETGYTNAVTTGSGGGVSVNYPQAFVRLGIGRHTEISVTPPSFNRSSVGGTIVSGSSDMNFGAKWELGYSKNAVWGFNAQASTPSGDPAFTAGGAGYTGNLNWSYTFNSIFGSAGTLGFNSLVGVNAAGQRQRYSAFIPTIMLTAALPGPSQVCAEFAYFSHAGPGLGPKRVIDFDYMRDLGPHAQVDIEYGFQPTVVNGQQVNYFGFGLSFMN